MPKGMLGNAPDPENDAGMLHGLVRVKQPWADCTDLRPLYVLRHDREPVAVDHFDVVVKKEQPGADRLFDCEIVQGREIERPLELQEPVLEVTKIFPRFL